MADRLDVRRMLLKRGWTEDRDGVCRKASASWTPFGVGTAAYDIALGTDVPARVITAIAELVAADSARTAAPAVPTR
jgi:hypothetical protein